MSNKKRLELVSVPRPCSIPWESMTGTDQARACAVCNRQVYDLAAMTSSEAEKLLDCRVERLCIRFNRGPEGKVITADRLPKWSPPTPFRWPFRCGPRRFYRCLATACRSRTHIFHALRQCPPGDRRPGKAGQ
jgi:hypothetical protein